jgi:hypothetical protein
MKQQWQLNNKIVIPVVLSATVIPNMPNQSLIALSLPSVFLIAVS